MDASNFFDFSEINVLEDGEYPSTVFEVLHANLNGDRLNIHLKTLTDPVGAKVWYNLNNSHQVGVEIAFSFLRGLGIDPRSFSSTDELVGLVFTANAVVETNEQGYQNLKLYKVRKANDELLEELL